MIDSNRTLRAFEGPALAAAPHRRSTGFVACRQSAGRPANGTHRPGRIAMLITAFASAAFAGEPAAPLWQIGRPDNSPAEFALAPTGFRDFFARFGSPDRAFYVGLSRAETDWPYVLPGPLDDWAGGGRRAAAGEWDMLHTLPIGFTLHAAPRGGSCVLTVHVAGAHAKKPPRLRATVNGRSYERELLPGGAAGSPGAANLAGAKPQRVEFEFPVSQLRAGYNEISLRSTTGNWLLFDAIELRAPPDTRLAITADTVIRSIEPAPYAISEDPESPATVRVEVYRHGAAGKLTAEIGERRPPIERTLEPGLQILEFAAPAGNAPVRIRLRSDGRMLREARLSLSAKPAVTPADYVDVFKGTAHSRWMIAPGPWMPFGMVKLAPDNQPQRWASGYDYGNEYIDCISHIHEWTMSGLGVMPTIGDVRTQPGLDGLGFSSRFDKSTECGGIGFYEVFLKDTGIKAELAATTRSSLQRYTFPASERARVIFDFLLPNEYPTHVLGATVRRAGPSEIEGTIATNSPRDFYEQRFDLHFVAQFSRAFDRLGGWQGAERRADAAELKLSGDCGAWIEFATRAGEQVLLRIGISLVSVANARLNLEREQARPFGWDFAAVVENQRRVWNGLLGRVEIETPDAREKIRFYTNLYRALSARNIWSDVNGEWIDPEERRQQLADSDAVMLGGDAFWNTFWNLNQVMNLLAPEWSARWVKSELAMYDACGWLSKGPAGLEYIPIMVAEHEIPLLVAAHQHGIKGVDAGKILAAAVKMQTTLPQKHPGGGFVGNEHLENYLRHGYVAVDGPTPDQPPKWKRATVSNTFEYAFDDWCVAQLARALGRAEVAAAFLRRSRNWRNVFDAEAGFARPRRANGEWVSPFDPFNTPGFVEGNAWQYTWFVPHDVPGLVDAMGRDRFVARLNEAFEQSARSRFSAPSAMHNLTPINHGNQPSMQVAWLFNWADRPWLSQKWIRAILDTYYGHTPADAYLGDEDQGQMSGWFVMSALGLFQTDGGCRVNPIYELGSPLYPKTVLHLSPQHYGGGTFTIVARNASRANRYIQSAELNGRPLDRWWIRQRDLVKGGRLVLEMGPTPNEAWARGAAPE